MISHTNPAIEQMNKAIERAGLIAPKPIELLPEPHEIADKAAAKADIGWTHALGEVEATAPEDVEIDITAWLQELFDREGCEGFADQGFPLHIPDHFTGTEPTARVMVSDPTVETRGGRVVVRYQTVEVQTD